MDASTLRVSVSWDLSFSAIDLEGEEGTPVDEEVGDDNLDYAASESGCSGCHNAQNISFWLVLALIVHTVKASLLWFIPSSDKSLIEVDHPIVVLN